MKDRWVSQKMYSKPFNFSHWHYLLCICDYSQTNFVWILEVINQYISCWKCVFQKRFFCIQYASVNKDDYRQLLLTNMKKRFSYSVCTSVWMKMIITNYLCDKYDNRENKSILPFLHFSVKSVASVVVETFSCSTLSDVVCKTIWLSIWELVEIKTQVVTYQSQGGIVHTDPVLE